MLRTIETDRMLLRPFEPDDVAAYAAIRAKPEVVRHLPGGEATVQQADEIAKRIVLDFAAQWDKVGYGPWAVIEATSGRLLGHTGLRRLPEMGGETKILYMLDSSAWGRGLAAEAAIAARDFAFTKAGLSRVIAMALPEKRRRCM